jgi:hypothetical protein
MLPFGLHEVISKYIFLYIDKSGNGLSAITNESFILIKQMIKGQVNYTCNFKSLNKWRFAKLIRLKYAKKTIVTRLFNHTCDNLRSLSTVNVIIIETKYNLCPLLPCVGCIQFATIHWESVVAS